MKNRLQRQRGVALIMVLMFLVALTLLGVSVVSNTSVEEKMALNARDQDLAFQAAEAAMRDARIRLTGIYASPATPEPFYNYNTSCTNGFCQNIPSASQPVYANFNMDAAPSVALGTTTGSPTLSVVNAQPRYLIERMLVPLVGGSATSPALVFRITAKGVGRRFETQVIVQEMFLP